MTLDKKVAGWTNGSALIDVNIYQFNLFKEEKPLLIAYFEN